MAQYVEILQSGPVLSPRWQELNEIFLASYSLKSYDGCEFGCPYCDGWALSETPINSCIYAALDRPEHLAKELSTIPTDEVIGFGFGEPYQPIEARYRITRRLLQVVSEQHNPVIIITKSPTVCEDIPILQVIHQQAFVVVAISLVTLDAQLSQKLEARAPSPEDRLKAVVALKQAGIPCGIALIPIFPFLTDEEAYLVKMFDKFRAIRPDFIVWDSLWVHKERHKDRIWKILSSLNNNLIDCYIQLYQNAKQPTAQYRRQMDERLLALCAHYGLAPRIPEHVYEQTLPLEIVTELRKRNRLFMLQDNRLEY
jgi:DNA repair photolyase